MNFRHLVSALALTVCAQAATTTSWQLTGYSDFVKGRFNGLSLSVDGTLQPGPSIERSVSLNQPAGWNAVRRSDGTVLIATGHNGQVLQLAADGRLSVLWTAPQPEVFALAAGPDNAIYAGTSPTGGVYRIDGGNAREIWRSPDKYIWSLQVGSHGSIYVGSGEQGRIYRIRQNGTAETYFETGQSNVTALTLSSSGTLYAGTDPNGLLFAIDASQHGTVLFDSSLPEIRSIVVGSNGDIFAAAMGGAVSTRTSTAPISTTTSAPATVTTSVPTVITVTEAADSSAAGPPTQTQTSSSTSTSTTTGAASTSAVTEVSGVDKSAIYRISPDHRAETLRTSKDDNVYDLALSGDALLFSTDVHGRIFRLMGRRSTLLADLGDGVTTRLLVSGDTVSALMSNPGRFVLLGAAGSKPAHYQSEVHDSTSVARWGHLQSHGTGTGVTFATRTGFSARPDATWSSWAPVDAGTSLIKSPAGRFIQWKAEWPVSATAALDSVAIPYLPRNGPPALHSITVSSIVGTNPAKSAGTTAASSSNAYTVTVTDTGEAPAASTANSANQTASRLQTTQTQISWQADDPDGDKLVYSVYFRAEDEKGWQLVRSRMYENTLTLDPDVFADGRYFFRVVASDSPSNAPEFSQETELVSTPVVIDNTPPVVTVGTPRRTATSVDVEVSADDKTSPLRVCEYSLDAGSWQPIESTDGVTDSQHESFALHLDNLRPGEHLLVFRVYDVVGNAGLGKVLLR